MDTFCWQFDLAFSNASQSSWCSRRNATAILRKLLLMKLGHLANQIWSHCLNCLMTMIKKTSKSPCISEALPWKTILRKKLGHLANLTISSNFDMAWILWAYPIIHALSFKESLRVGLQEVVDTDEVPINMKAASYAFFLSFFAFIIVPSIFSPALRWITKVPINPSRPRRIVGALGPKKNMYFESAYFSWVFLQEQTLVLKLVALLFYLISGFGDSVTT